MRDDRVMKCIFNRDYLQCNVNNWSSDMNNLCEQLELDIMNLNSLFHPYWSNQILTSYIKITG